MRIAVLASVGRRLDMFGGLLVAGLLLHVVAAKAEPVAPEPPALTNLLEVRHLAAQRQQMIHTIRLEGNVWQIDPSSGVLVLHDDSGLEFLKLDLQGYSIKPNQRVRLEVKGCAVKGRGFGLSFVPHLVVENDGFHAMREESGSVFLKSGLYPIQLRWFNSTGPFGLKVEYEGPGLPRQLIPDPVLFRAQGNPATFSTNFVNGLDYRCYEGHWEYLPDFDNMTPVKTGIVTNFDLGVRSQDEAVGLEFGGFVKIRQDGVYNFHMTSDDGSRLFVGESSVSVELLGEATSPVPRKINAIQPMEDEERQWGAVEGSVEFAGEEAEGGELELRVGNDLMRVDVFDDSGLLPTFPLHSRVLADGVCQSVTNNEGLRVPGVLLVSSWEAIHQLKVQEPLIKPIGERAGTYPSEAQKAGAAGEDRPGLPVLTTAEAIKALNREEAARQHPFEIRGVVTAVIPAFAGAVLQDTTRGIYVEETNLNASQPLRRGEFCEITGVTGPGLFAPLVMAERVVHLGEGYLPEPIHPTWDQLINGSLDSQYAEIEGIVTAVQEGGIVLLTEGGTIKLDLFGFKLASLRRYENALVRVRGSVIVSFNSETHQLKTGYLRVFDAAVDVARLAPHDPFDAPRKNVRELLLFDPKAAPFRRIKIGGQIIHGHAGDFFVMDGTNGLRVTTKDAAEFQPGDLVEAVGFLELGGPAPALKEAVAHKTGQAALPEPTRITAGNLLNASYNGTLVRVQALLVDEWDDPSEKVLELQSGFLVFKARLSNHPRQAPSLRVGSRLDLTGVYAAQGRNPTDREINSFELLLNSPPGIRVLATPPWWTLKRLLVLAGVLAGLLSAVLVWNSQLRRQVGERTAQLEKEIRSREQAELQRAAEAERSRIARDLHDDLGSGLTEVSLLADRGLGETPGNEKQAERLHVIADKARGLVAALDVIVWAVNPNENSLQSFADYLSGAAKEFLMASGVACRFKIPMEFDPVTLSGQIRHHLFLAVKEALNNVVRHARATEAELRIKRTDNQLEIAIADNGCGFDVGKASYGNGLANLSSRLNGLGGRCDIETQSGKGTTVKLTLPLPLPPVGEIT
ncbi:MAG: ATP-binding protein [Verrucomicrobiota bacterium]|jgi:signal transduction histidine kinase